MQKSWLPSRFDRLATQPPEEYCRDETKGHAPVKRAWYEEAKCIRQWLPYFQKLHIDRLRANGENGRASCLEAFLGLVQYP
jgi:hypothetical protein